MKKILLLCASALAISGIASAENLINQPAVLEGASISAISPDGSWVVSPLYGSLVIVNTQTSDGVSFEPDEDYYFYYTPGNGNSLSNVGIMAGCQYYEGGASYYDAISGDWYDLPVNPETDILSETLANGITPDGKRICGTVGRGAMFSDDMEDNEDIQMAYPAYWEMDAEGNYGMYKLLPCPEKDLFGLVPQRVTALSISDDGHTIVGQIIDCRGMVVQPIIYTENEAGEWSYVIPCDNLYHPDIEIPALPENPGYPQIENYMSEEQLEAWEAALDKYYEDEVYKPMLYTYMTDEQYEAYYDALYADEDPQIVDYMDPDQYEAYTQALAEYEAWIATKPNMQDYMTPENYEAYLAHEAAYEEYSELEGDYYDALQEYIDSVPVMTFNTALISPDGNYVAMSQDDTSSWGWPAPCWPVIIDVKANELIAAEEYGIPTYINNEGVVMVAQSIDGQNYAALISLDKLATLTPLQEYVLQKNQQVYDFMNETMRHSYTAYDWETDEEVMVEDAWLTGVPCATADLKTLITYVSNCWDPDGAYYYSYVLPMDYDAGIDVAEVSGKELSVSGAQGGIVTISGDVNLLEVYDAQGRLVYRQDAPAASVATGLPAGIYMLKVYGANGTAAAKAAF